MKKILGIMDLEKFGKLGEILMFIELIKIKKETSAVDLAIIGSDNEKINNTKALLKNYLGDSEIKVVKSKEGLDYEYFFPSETDLKKGNPLDSTNEIKKFYSDNGYIPILSSYMKEKAQSKIKDISKDKIPVVVHLKNTNSNESDANLKEWYKFFKYCSDNYEDVMFILIGNDPVTKEIENLPNIELTKNKLSLLEELSLIEVSSLFMGMCSGPFQIALFSKIPYVVFKNPEHHKEEMLQEIGKDNKYVFATENQFIFRENESFESLVDNFKNMYEVIRI